MSVLSHTIAPRQEDHPMTTRSLARNGFAQINFVNRDWDSLQFRFIFALSFLFYLVTAVALRFTPQFWREAAAHRSILGDAIEAAGTMAQIAFHG